MISHLQLLILAVLFAIFLGVPTISKMLGSTLDILPIRIAAVLLILVSVQYDKLISLAVFLVIAGLYIHHHNNDVTSVLSRSNPNIYTEKTFEVPSAMKNLHHGGYSDIATDDGMDFMPKRAIQDNEVESVHESINEKHVLESEPLGSSKAYALFNEDTQSLEKWSKD